MAEMKRQIVHTLQKYLFNPPIKVLFAMGVGPPGYALLETTGRKTGKARRIPVGDARVGGRFWIVAEHGMKAGLRAHWHTGTAYVLSDDDPRARQRWLTGQLPSSAANAAAVRLFGTDLLTVRIDLDG